MKDLVTIFILILSSAAVICQDHELTQLINKEGKVIDEIEVIKWERNIIHDNLKDVEWCYRSYESDLRFYNMFTSDEVKHARCNFAVYRVIDKTPNAELFRNGITTKGFTLTLDPGIYYYYSVYKGETMMMAYEVKRGFTDVFSVK